MNMKRLFLMLSIGAVAISMTANPVIYVTPNGSGDGSSWTNAFNNIQTALDAAYASGEYTEVWVAAGTYIVTEAITTQDSVSLFGGFAGTETSIDQRVKASDKPWDFQNRTVIDGANQCRLFSTIQNADTIIEINGIEFVNGHGTDADAPVRLRKNAYLHNCIVRNCYNNTSGGGGCQVYPAADFSGCLFKDNRQADHANGGGGLFINVSSSGYTSMVENCEFCGNSSSIRGAGICIQGDTRVTVKNCRIYNNTCRAADESLLPGAGIFDNTSLTGVVVNNLIYNNTGNNAVYAKSLLFANNTIIDNIGNVYIATANSSSQFINNLMWGNFNDEACTTPTSFSGVAAEMLVANNASYIAPSIDKGWNLKDNIQFSSNVSNGKVSNYEFGVGSGPILDTVPNFIGAVVSGLSKQEQETFAAYLSEFNFNLTAESPCQNAGSEALYEQMVITTTRVDGVRVKDTLYIREYYAEYDMNGLKRPQGGAYDMGAVELPYYQLGFDYDSELGSVLSDEGDILTVDTVLVFAKGQNAIVYIFADEREISKIEKVYAAESVDITDQLSEEGMLIIMVDDAMTLKVTFSEIPQGIENILSSNEPAVIYNIQGMIVDPATTLPTGVYIIRQGAEVHKIFVR